LAIAALALVLFGAYDGYPKGAVRILVISQDRPKVISTKLNAVAETL